MLAPPALRCGAGSIGTRIRRKAMKWIANTLDPKTRTRPASPEVTEWLKGKVLGEPQAIPGGVTVERAKAMGLVGVYEADEGAQP